MSAKTREYALRHDGNFTWLMKSCSDRGCDSWQDIARFDRLLEAEIVLRDLNDPAALGDTDE